jgi:anti-anti-sigma regulatory factor
MNYPSHVPGTFDVEALPDLPIPGQRTLVLTARTDLDLHTRETARAEMLAAMADPSHALVLDLGGVFIAAVVVRDLVELSERASHAGRPLAVVGAPPWLVDLAGRLDVPPVRFAGTVGAAAEALRAAAGAAVPMVP